MSANVTETTPQIATAPPVPKRITNAQTVCNERNEKNKLCNGHLKQLNTAGEASEVHLRGDDVLSKCHLCGTLYMGPPLGHVRDPNKQMRFVEADLAALLQAAGGTLPVIKKNDRGVYVMVESEGAAPAHGAPAAKPAAPAAAKPSAPAAPATAAAKTPTAVTAAKTSGEPDRALNRRSTYVGFQDTGPVAGESKEQKIARLAQLVEAVRKRTDEGGGPEPATTTGGESSPAAVAVTPAEPAPESAAPATQTTSPASPTPSGEVDRGLNRRSTYAGFTDTGPVAGETHEQKVARLAALVEGVRQRNTGG